MIKNKQPPFIFQQVAVCIAKSTDAALPTNVMRVYGLNLTSIFNCKQSGFKRLSFKTLSFKKPNLTYLILNRLGAGTGMAAIVFLLSTGMASQNAYADEAAYRSNVNTSNVSSSDNAINAAFNNAYGAHSYNTSGSLMLDNTPYASQLNEGASAPDLTRQGIGFADQHQNRLVGEWSLQRVNGGIKTLNDPWVQTVINNLTWQLNAQVRQQAPLAVVIVDNPTINAFAIPGGVIGLNTGTITAAKSIDEVASVLAHEVAHLSQRHYEHSDEARRKALLMQVGGMLAAIAASAADGDAAAAIMLGSQTAAIDSQMAFSRSNEREADRLGMQIMAQTGYDPKAMPRFFATLDARSQLNQTSDNFIPSFARTHPLSDERLSEAQSRAQQYPTQSLAQQSQKVAEFDLLYWRVQMLSNQAGEQALKQAAKTSQGAALALVTWLANQQKYADAQALLTSIESQDNVQLQALQPLLAITQSELAGAQNQWQKAIDTLQKQQQLYPERRDLRLYLANALIRQAQIEATQPDATAAPNSFDGVNKAQQAQTLLKPLTLRQQSDIAAWQGLVQANEHVAKYSIDERLANIAAINALRYRSQVELWQAQYNPALVSLTQAKTRAEQQNITALLATIDKEIESVKTAQAFKP